jgi:hypothetical protein
MPLPPRRPLSVFVAVLALLLAQGLGLAHRIAHPSVSALEQARHAHEHEHDHGALSAAFDAQHDEGSAECRLLEQLAHAHGLLVAALHWAAVAPVQPAPHDASAALTARSALRYQARAPPATPTLA